MLAVWFIFDKEDSTYLSHIIKHLSTQYNSSIFVPHITAYGLVDVELDVIDKIVANSIKNKKSFIVEKSNVSYSDDFWKTLFIEIYPNNQLTIITKILTESLTSFSKYEFKPHVSLVYKEMNLDEKKKLVNTLNIKNSFKISGMCIVQFSEDIKKWKIVREYVLD